MELELGGFGVGEDEGEQVAAHVLVVVQHLVAHHEVGHHSVAQVLQDLGVGNQCVNSGIALFGQCFDDFQYFECNFVLLYAVFLVHFAERFDEALEDATFDQPGAHAVVNFEDLVVVGFLGYELMKELNAGDVDVGVGVVEQFENRHQYLGLDHCGDVFLPDLLEMLQDGVDFLLVLVEPQGLGRVLHP